MEGVSFLSSERVMHSTDAYVQGPGSLGHQRRADSAVQRRNAAVRFQAHVVVNRQPVQFWVRLV